VTEHRLRSIWAIVAVNGFLPMKRQPLYLVNTLTSPFSFLFLIFIISQGRLLGYGVAGGMVLTVLSIGTSLQSDLTHYRQDLKLHEMMVASPVGPGTYVTGMALSEFMFSLPGMVVFVVLSVLYTHYVFGVLSVLIILATLILVWIFATSLGFTLATYLADVRETFAVSPIISIFLTVVPPVYYPIGYLPIWLQPIAYAAPTTWAANLVQGALGLGTVQLSLDRGLLDAGVLLLTAAILFVIAWKKAQWRES
jgi:ABC-2 type transport system permease protein